MAPDQVFRAIHGRGFATGARAGAKTGRAVDRFWHKITGASGASRTGLAALIELTAIGGAGDAFVAVALAGTIFFSTSVTEARGRVVLFLLVTMAPFAVSETLTMYPTWPARWPGSWSRC